MSDWDIIGDMFDDDESLAELISGAGTSEIVGGNDDLMGAIGASLQRRGGNSGAKREMLRQILAKNAGGVLQKQLKDRRRYPLGFAVTVIPLGSGGTVVPAAPQNLFRGERPVFPSDIAFDLTLLDLKVGNQSQFAQASVVPASVFTEVAIDTRMTFDTAEIGNQMSATIGNPTAADVTLRAAIIGTVARA